MSKKFGKTCAALAVALLLALNPDVAIGSTLGWDQDDNKLIDRKLAQVNSGDPDYVKDGKFYDVGRNPDPMDTYAQTDFGDYRFRVTHIKFDISGDVGSGDIDGEGLEIQHGHSNGARLDHIKDGRSKGEWIYSAYPDPAAGRNEPALYKCGDSVKIRARIECAAPIDYAYVGAKQVVEGGQAAQWLDVKKTKVHFRPHPDHPNDVCVSAVYTPADPDTGAPAAFGDEWVPLELIGNIKNSIDRSTCVWQWYVDQIKPEGGGGEWKATTVCKHNMDGWEINRSAGEVTTVDQNGMPQTTNLAHTFYTVLGKPADPYYRDGAGQGLPPAYPWVTALDFAISSPVNLAGTTSAEVAATRIANFCYSEYNLRYDHVSAASKWVTGQGALAHRTIYDFQFSAFIAYAGGGAVPDAINCLDQACAVSTLIDLVSGADAVVQWLPEFGYVQTKTFIGGAQSNNPGWEGGHGSGPIVGDNDTRWRADIYGVPKRSVFEFHTWVKVGTTYYDATLGDGSAATKCAEAAYKAAVCDVSNASSELNWRDNEKVAQKRDAVGVMTPPSGPWLVSGYQDTVYTIDVDDEGATAEHANMARIKPKNIRIE